MRRGRSPTVRKRPYAGDILSVGHIIPCSIAPELDNVISNLKSMPLRLNQSKGNKIGQRQRDHAQKLYVAGLLSERTKIRLLTADPDEEGTSTSCSRKPQQCQPTLQGTHSSGLLIHVVLLAPGQLRKPIGILIVIHSICHLIHVQ